jgi:hypothetical protein
VFHAEQYRLMDRDDQTGLQRRIHTGDKDPATLTPAAWAKKNRTQAHVAA